MNIIYMCPDGRPRKPSGLLEESAKPDSSQLQCSEKVKGDNHTWYCTRLPGHSENHITAFSTGEICAMWNDEPEETKTGMTIETRERRVVLTGIDAPDVKRADPPVLTLSPTLSRALKALALEFRDDVYAATQFCVMLSQGDIIPVDSEEIVLALQAAFVLETKPSVEIKPSVALGDTVWVVRDCNQQDEIFGIYLSEEIAHMERGSSQRDVESIQIGKQYPRSYTTSRKREIDTNPDAFSCSDAEAPGVIWCVIKEGEVYGAYTSRKDAETFQNGRGGDLCQFVSAEQCEGLDGRTVWTCLDHSSGRVSVHETEQEAREGVPAWAVGSDRYHVAQVTIES